MSKRVTTVKIGPSSELLAERRFYLDTFLVDNKRPSSTGKTHLFVVDAVLIRGSSGREFIRTRHDVLEFPTEYDLLAAVSNGIESGGWVENNEFDGNPSWRPTRDQMLGDHSAGRVNGSNVV